MFSKSKVSLKKVGYSDLNTVLKRDEKVSVKNVCCGFFLWPLLFWVYEYNPERVYIMNPIDENLKIEKQNQK